jgi:hypothetical protein
MLLLTSNSVFDVSSSNAIVTFVADGLSDPAQASAGIRNATEGTTIWGQNLRILDASTASNTIWIADITNGASFGTNRQVAVFVSSNSAAVVKGCAAAMGE